jgi:murein L,D-transpeptidase YafK
MKTRLFTAALLAAVVGGGVWVAVQVAPSAPLAQGVIADHILVEKSQRRMTLFSDGKPLKTYAVSLGRGEPGKKAQRGDLLTPVGHYSIRGRNPNSAAHLSLWVSYPNENDAAQATARGVSPGSFIMIHGIMNGWGWVGGFHRFVNWTAGCVAVTDTEMDEIWRAVPDGTTIEIAP